MKSFLENLIASRKGATAIEYGLIAALIAVAAMGAMGTFGNKSGQMWNHVEDNIVQE
ncbi:MAG: Flp family type IVb pilin [Blastomonas sp.]